MKNKFKIPRKLNICGHNVPIIMKAGLVADGKECWGVFDEGNETIYLRKGMTLSRKMEILLHEVIHAIEHINGLSLPENSVKVLALGILGFIKNNNIDFLK